MSDGTPPHVVVAANVRAELARERWTGRKAAAAMGVTQPYLQRRLNGSVPLDADDLVALAELRGVPVGRFFEATGAEPTPG